MADNVQHPLTGTGTPNITQATDDIAGVHYVKMKLVDGTADSTAMIPGDATNGLDVDVTRWAHLNGTPSTASWTSATPDETVLSITTTGQSLAMLQLAGNGQGASAGRLEFEASGDGGTTWTWIYGFDSSWQVSLVVTSFLNLVDYQATTGLFVFPLNGATNFRVRLSTPITGSETFALRLYGSTVAVSEMISAASLDTVAKAYQAAGAPSPSLGQQVGGSDGTNFRTLKVDANGELQVDVLSLPALPAGTNNIGDVDVLSVPAPLSTTGGGTEAAALRVTLASDSTGVVSIDDNGAALTVDNGGTFAVQDSEKITDNAGFTDGTSKVLLSGHVFDEVAGTALTENDAAASRIDSKRAQVLVLEDATTRGQRAVVSAAGRVSVDASGVAVPVTDNAGSITVDAPTGTPVNVQVGNGTLQVGVVDETGVSAVDALAVGGGTPHDSVDSGNPVKIGAKAANALPTPVANADRANLLADLFGRLLVTSLDPAMQVTKDVNVTTTQTGTDVWDPAAGKKIAVTSLIIGSYGTTAARVILWFGDNADTTYTAGTDQVLAKASFAPSATSKPGLVINFDPPIYCTTADRELHLTTDAAISLDITVHGFEW